MTLPPRIKNLLPEALPGVDVPEELKMLLANAAEDTFGFPGPRYF
jgi:hypothetical protein